jgi:hypothetical protein
MTGAIPQPASGSQPLGVRLLQAFPSNSCGRAMLAANASTATSHFALIRERNVASSEELMAAVMDRMKEWLRTYGGPDPPTVRRGDPSRLRLPSCLGNKGTGLKHRCSAHRNQPGRPRFLFFTRNVCLTAAKKARQAYVVDADDRLIAQPDISLVLRNTDMTKLAQVQAARMAAASPKSANRRLEVSRIRACTIHLAFWM